MLINEACRRAGLTKKAIEYYTAEGLVSPRVLENGYRDYGEEDVAILGRIGVLRKLDIGIDDIRAILGDGSGSALQRACVEKELALQRDGMKKAALEKLSAGAGYSDIKLELQAIENAKTITEKLLEAFPGYYGRFVCMHFARFLNEPIRSAAQQAAYAEIIEFLDGVPPLEMPKELEEYLIDGTRHLGTDDIAKLLESTKRSIENPDEFLSENKEVLEQYLAYKQSAEYKASPAFQLMELMKRFNSASGYNDVFLNAMKRLSAPYAEYCHQMELANEKLLARYPEIG